MLRDILDNAGELVGFAFFTAVAVFACTVLA